MGFEHADDPGHPIPAETEATGRAVLDAAFEVHSEFGPGLLESVYLGGLAEVLRGHGLAVETQVAVPLSFRGRPLGTAFRIDLLVAREVVVEVKSVDQLAPVHSAQLQTYLRLAGHRLGYLINFNVPQLKLGLVRLIETRPR